MVFVLRSETHALVTISNVWDSERDKKCLEKAFYFGSSMRKLYVDLDFYLRYLQGNQLLG